MHRLVEHVRSNLVGWLALFIALGGTSYAAISIPRGSVGAPQLRNHAITPVKFNPATIGGAVRAWAIIGSSGKVVASSAHAIVTTIPSQPGYVGIRWGVHLPATCATAANIDQRSSAPTEILPIPGGTESIVAGYVSQVETKTAKRPGNHGSLSTTSLVTLNQSGQPTPLGFDITIIC